MRSEPTLSVLIVEDERIVAIDLQQTLSRMGYDAFAIAASADEAMQRASERRPDVVLMDIRIKGDRDGVETATLLRQQFEVPIVYLTAHADDATVERAKHTEPYGYLLKPVKSAELRSVLEVSLYKHAMERKLRERERWFSTTLRSIADSVVAVDTAGNVIFMNSAAEALTGMALEAALDRPARDVMRLGEGSVESPLERALEGRVAVFLEEASLTSASGVFIISDSAAPVIDGDQLLGAVMVFKDVTKQKAQQSQLEAAARLISLGTMAAGVAHEVNNPLSALFLNATFVREELLELLAEMKRDESGQTERIATLEGVLEANSEVLATAQGITRIVADLTMFSRPDGGTIASRGAARADVAAVVDWAIRTSAPQLRHRARVTTEIGDVPTVAIDERKLGQVLLNLLINASHAIPHGEPGRHEVRVVARMAEPSMVLLQVHDSGGGMSDEVMSRVFEPFFTTKPQGEGTGLGLSISYGIVKAAGGELRVESRPGEGTVFTLELPVAPSPAFAA